MEETKTIITQFYICATCEIEIPQRYFDNPLTYGNLVRKLTLNHEEQICQNVSRKLKNKEGRIKHKKGICNLLPLWEGNEYFAFRVHSRGYSVDFDRNLRIFGYSVNHGFNESVEL